MEFFIKHWFFPKLDNWVSNDDENDIICIVNNGNVGTGTDSLGVALIRQNGVTGFTT
jgi:hypothetical protein